MSKKRLERLYEEFRQIPCIHDHFQITGYIFKVDRIDDYTFHFTSRTTVTIKLNLPEDLNKYIQSYLTDNCLIQIKYPLDYPFKCPHFELIEGPTKQGIHILNYAYDRDWSPAITFEKDILNLIQYII